LGVAEAGSACDLFDRQVGLKQQSFCLEEAQPGQRGIDRFAEDAAEVLF